MTPCVMVKANTNTGYRYVQINGARFNAARLALEAALGRPLRPGHVPDHLCRVRNCINPDHLEEVTVSENNRRAALGRKRSAWSLLVSRRPRRYGPPKPHGLDDPEACPKGHTGQFSRPPSNHGGRKCLACDRERHYIKYHRTK